MAGNRYAVIGLGTFGTVIARNLSDKGMEVLAIDNNEGHIEAIKDDVALAVTMDATDKKALLAQGITDVEAAVVAIGEDFEALLLTTVYLMELNVKRVIARANDPQQRKILEKIGVSEILSPEDEVAKVVTERLLNPSVLSFLQLPDGYEIVELKAPPGIVGRSLQDIELRNTYKMNLVTIKRCFDVQKGNEKVKEEHILGVPSSQTVISPTDTIVVFAQVQDIEKFMEINN